MILTCDSYELYKTSQLLGRTFPTFCHVLAICLLSHCSCHVFCFVVSPCLPSPWAPRTRMLTQVCVCEPYSLPFPSSYPHTLCLKCSSSK